MKTVKNKTNPAWILILISCFMAIRVHAEPSPRSLFPISHGLVQAFPSLALRSFSGNEQPGWRGAGYGPGLGNGVVTILAGVAGNLVGMYAGIYLGSVFPSGPIWGAAAGSIVGTALGVYLAGSSCGRGGNFGAALGGSLLGELAALGLALAIHTEDAPFMAGFLILPPIGAALVFNSSQRNLSSRAGSGFLNLAEGKLGLGVPDVHIRPVFVPGGGNAKPEFQFNVNVLSVEL